jgi:hypothetical protein
MRPSVDRLRVKREGSGNDNWGFSSKGMMGFGANGNSSWLDQYDNRNGGFGTYLGGGRTMPDKRQGNGPGMGEMQVKNTHSLHYHLSQPVQHDMSLTLSAATRSNSRNAHDASRRTAHLAVRYRWHDVD